ncbi:MAG: hypothetical protein ABJG68_14825 [Crocinitomicaceae bacterium]
MIRILLLVTGFLSFQPFCQSDYGVKFKITAPDGFTDETVVRLNHDASSAFDGAYDAFKWFTWNNEVPSIYSNSSNNDPLSINTHDFMDKDTTMMIWMRAMITGGTFTMETEQMGAFPENVKLALKDIESNVVYELDQDLTFNFSVSTSPNDFERFELFYSAEASVDTVGQSAIVTNMGNYNWEYELYDSMNQVIESNSVTDQFITLEDLNPGLYTVLVTDAYSLVDTLVFEIQEVTNPTNGNEAAGELAERAEDVNPNESGTASLFEMNSDASLTISVEFGQKFINYKLEELVQAQLNIYNYAGQLLISKSVSSEELDHYLIPENISAGIILIQSEKVMQSVKF